MPFFDKADFRALPTTDDLDEQRAHDDEYEVDCHTDSYADISAAALSLALYPTFPASTKGVSADAASTVSPLVVSSAVRRSTNLSLLFLVLVAVAFWLLWPQLTVAPSAAALQTRPSWQWPSAASTDSNRSSESLSPPPPPPRLSWVLRCYSGMRRQLYYLYRSMELFLPAEVLDDVVLILDESEADIAFANTLPSFVKVRFEGAPPLSANWTYSVRGKNYDEALYSGWVADRYTSADIICALDPDILFTSAASLYSMFVYDTGSRAYLPRIECLGHISNGYPDSHRFFNLSHLPHLPYCMAQLPVCTHRSTLVNVRQALVAQRRPLHQELFTRLAEYDEFAIAYSVLTENFTRQEPICQFCVWSTFIMSEPSELSRYYVGIGSTAHHNSSVIADFNAAHPRMSMCPAVRAAVHMPYIGFEMHNAESYAQLGDKLLTEGICRSGDQQSADCLTAYCAKHGWDNSTLHDLTLRWERQPNLVSEHHNRTCHASLMSDYQLLAAWQQKHQPSTALRQRACGALSVQQEVQQGLLA